MLARALASALTLDEVQTAGHGEGARAARESDHDLIVVLGGDGTVNDVTTGLIDSVTGRSRGPRLAVVPGGSTNVFARAIGMPTDPVEATGQLLDAIENHRERTLSIGALETDENPRRTFLFSASMGVDAHTVATMERARRPFGLAPMGISRGRYLAAASASLLSRAGRGRLQVHFDGRQERAELAIATTNPVWTYLGRRALSLTPHASFESGLSLFTADGVAPDEIGPILLSLARHGRPSGGHEFNDIGSIEITNSRPLPVQADGEALLPATRLRLTSLPQALTVFV